MYKNLYFDRKTNQIHLWTDGKHNDKEYEVFDYKKYAYVVDSKGEHTTLTGLKVKKVTSWGKEAEKAGMVFEHDVPVSTRTLIDRYYETDDVAVNLTVLFFDIEVEKGLRYSTAKEAKNKITSIAYYDTKNQKYVCLLLDEKGKLTDCKKQIKVTETENTIEVYVKVYRKESELLQAFVSHWNKIKPDIISSWNGDYFDIPYLHNRIENVLGINYARKLSPIGITEERQVTKRDIVINIAGIAQMDYLQLYKKFTYNEESSYTLEAISQKELKRGKFKYDGTLDELYENDIDGFIEYNVNDVELIVSLDKKMDLIEIARGICHKGHVPYDDYSMSSKYLDGAIQTRCRRKNLITVTNLTKTINFVADIDEIFIKIKKQYISLREVIRSKLNLADKTKVYECTGEDYELVGVYYTKNQKKSSEIIITSNKAKGAFVKPPNVGIHKWVYSIDAQSLYPSLIITMNNSLETQVASIEDWYKYDLNSHNLYSAKLSTLENFGYLPDDVVLTVNPIAHEIFSDRDTEPLQLNKQQFIDYVKSFDGTVSSRGVIFTTKKRGIIPEILDEWFDERQMFKKKMKDYEFGSELYIYYDRLQLITKILLNSLYGVLLLPTFRYYSKLSGESVTLSGQSVIKFADVLANLFYRRKLKDRHKTNCVIYQDSDSCYLDARPLIENFDELTDYEKTVQTQLISNEVTEFVNTGIKWFASQCFHSNDNRLIFNQEKISKTAFWGQAKKRYAQLMMEVSGDKVIEKVKITGFDVVKSSFPKVFRKIMTGWIGDILQLTPISELNGKIRDFKKVYTQSKLTDIMLPTSVKEISKYEYGEKGTPIHIKSAQNYNKLLELHKIESLPPFDDGDKILYAYMRQNPYGFETMAIRGYDDPPEILEFVERFVDKEKVFNNTLISKLDTIWKDLGFGTVQLQEQSNFF